MDSFLSDLYKENMEKQAGVELREFYDSLSVEQLEQVLGLTKVAVGGAAEPEIPDGSPVKKYLDAAEKAVAKKTTPAELPTASSTVAGTAPIESGKQLLQSSTGKPEPTTPFVPREIKTTDDPGLGSRDVESTTVFDRQQSGSQNNKTAGAIGDFGKKLVAGAVNKAQESATPVLNKMVDQQIDRKIKELGPKAALAGGGLLGGSLAAGGVGGYVAGKHSKGKNKSSTVFDQLEGKVAADLTLKKRESLPAAKFAIPEKKAKKIGVAGEIVGSSKGKYPIPDAVHARNALARVAQHGTPAEKAIVQRKVHAKFPGIGEKTASERAELLITALRATKDAPEYVKHAAAKYVGERL